ncbi:hypothetical protein PoB_005387300 [Plakobranchus ocellatus]|uniref:Uncharacterized protein n=1 Tax=Plakobranchus ocellatus TaxID=259542 RepID=A0AAV4C677_9GAST|nr:hypothetical protein PoB_005387300 [Plakobranchus ocellatus]
MKPAAPPKDGGRSAPFALPKWGKAQKDSGSNFLHSNSLAKRRSIKSKRQEAPRESFSRFAPLTMEAKDTLFSIWGIPPVPRGPLPPLWSVLSSLPFQISPAPGEETPEVHVTE